MNERIRELARQSDLDWHKFWNDDESNRMEKFAELIVRECLLLGDVLSKHYIDTHSEQEQAMLLASIADYTNEIKKHFGVEE